MSEKMIENNKVSVIGEVVSGIYLQPRSVRGRVLSRQTVAVSRLSEQAGRDSADDFRAASGCIGRLPRHARWRRSASSVPTTVMRASKNRLVLSVFVREIHFLEEVYGLH